MAKRKRKDKEPKEAPVVKNYVQPPPGLQEFIFYIVESNEDMNAEFCDQSCPSSKIEIIGADMAYIVHRLDSSVEVQLVDKEVSPDPNVSYIKKSITCRILKGIEYNWRLEVAADDHDTVITTPSSVRDYAEEFVEDMLKEKIFQARQDQVELDRRGYGYWKIRMIDKVWQPKPKTKDAEKSPKWLDHWQLER